MMKKRVIILSTQDGDWEALYIDGKLHTEGHTIGEGDRFYIWKQGIEHGFTPKDISFRTLDDDDELIAMETGVMPDSIEKYEE